METKEYRLTDICDFQGGTQPPKEEWITEPRDGYVRMLQIRDFTQDKAEHVGYVKDTKNLNKCKEDDILIGRYGASVGKILTGLSGAYNVAIIKTIPDEELLSKRYLYYVLTGTDFQNFILNIGARAAQAGFNKGDLSLFKFYLPNSLKDQEMIADVLEKAKNLIDKRGESIDLLDEFLKMKFLEMFGNPTSNPMNWEKDAVIKYSDCMVPGRDKPKSFTGNIPWIRTEDLKNKSFFSDSKEGFGLSMDEISAVKGKIIPIGSVVITCVGQLNIISINEKECIINQQLHSFQCKEEMNNIFLMFSLSFQEKFMYQHASTTTVAYMNKSICNSIPVIKPPIVLQEKFAKFVSQIEKIKMFFIANVVSLKDLYEGLSHKALKGKLEIKEGFIFNGKFVLEPPVSAQVDIAEKLNEKLKLFYENQEHTGAPAEIDNTIRQLETELQIRGEIPFWDEYLKYRIVKGKFKKPFTFDQLWEEITKVPFETTPKYDDVSSLLFKWLAEENAFIRQQFNESTKQLELIVNETAKA